MVLRLEDRVVVQRSNIMDFNALDFLYAMLDLLLILKESLEKSGKGERAYVFGKKGNGRGLGH
jgi:hypothetical protein